MLLLALRSDDGDFLPYEVETKSSSIFFLDLRSDTLIGDISTSGFDFFGVKSVVDPESLPIETRFVILCDTLEAAMGASDPASARALRLLFSVVVGVLDPESLEVEDFFFSADFKTLLGLSFSA